MTVADVCNWAAWLGCAAMGGLLLTDFVRTERRIQKARKREADRDER